MDRGAVTAAWALQTRWKGRRPLAAHAQVRAPDFSALSRRCIWFWWILLPLIAWPAPAVAHNAG
jgi:hypothetical protein